MPAPSDPPQPSTSPGGAERSTHGGGGWDARARSFGRVADVYDRARPGYPDDAVDWLVGPQPSVVLELGAGTGKLTEGLLRAGHEVVATDLDPAMLEQLVGHLPVTAVAARAERIPLLSRSVDVVVCAQALHWFDNPRAYAEIARVLRPGGVLAVANNRKDTSVPWVRRLDALAPVPSASFDARMALLEAPHFGYVEEARFRFWQDHTLPTLRAYLRSVSSVSTLPEDEQDALEQRLDRLYADYGRGPDGMRLPWLTDCYRTVVRHDQLREVQDPVAGSSPTGSAGPSGEDPPSDDPEDPGTLLIDFR